MKSLPPLTLILSAFGVLAMVVFFYGRSGPEPLPTPRSTWDEVRIIRQEIEDRKRVLAVGQAQELDREPYLISVERLVNVSIPDPVGRYVIRVRPSAGAMRVEQVKNRELAVAWFDVWPDRSVGRLQVAAIRQPRIEEE